MVLMPSWLPKLLKEQSFLQSHAFWNDRFHNHKAHSIVAIARLGASEERVRRHCQWQDENGGIITFAKEPNLKQPIEVDSIKSDNIADYLGKDVGFYKILDHFTKLFKTKYENDLNAFVSGELPELIDGQLGSLFHGIIQLGYGYAAKSDQVVVEGMALCHEQFALVTSPKNPRKARDISAFGKGTTDLLDILKDIRENKKDDWKNASSSIPVIDQYGDLFLDYVDKVKLPDWFDAGKEDMCQVVKLMEWLRDMAMMVYVQAEHVNDFHLLHGITGAWSLLQVIDLVDYKTAVRAIRAHLVAFLIVYTRVDAPTLTHKPEDYWKDETVDQAAWDHIIQDTLAEEYENHIFKVVQCLYEAWKKDPNSPYAKHYIAGSRAALDNDIHHIRLDHPFSRFAGQHNWAER